MRHYMVDPDNEERLLKIPPRVVAAIKVEAYEAAREAVAEIAKDTYCDSAPCWGAERYIAAIDTLREEHK